MPSAETTRQRPLVLRIEGGPDPMDYRVYDDATGDQLTNIVAIDTMHFTRDGGDCTIELMHGLKLNAKALAVYKGLVMTDGD